MVRVEQWSGCIKKSGKTFDVSVAGVAKTLGVIMGNLSGVGDILVNLPETISIVCMGSDSENRFMKVEMNEDGTKMVGVSLYGTNFDRQMGCRPLYNYFEFNTELHCKLIVAHVSDTDTEKIDQLRNFFDRKFGKIIEEPDTPISYPEAAAPDAAAGGAAPDASTPLAVHMVSAESMCEREPRRGCTPSTSTRTPVKGTVKEYIINMSECVPSDTEEDVNKINLEDNQDEPNP